LYNEDYIASGILELYAAQGLTEAEREEVERRAATSPEIRLALEKACAAMEAYAGLYAVRPRPDLKDRIMQRIGNPVQEAHLPPAADTPVRKLYPEAPKETAGYKWMFAASITLFLLTGLLSFHFYNKWQQAEERIASMVGSAQLLAQNFKRTSLQLQKKEETLAILRNREFKLVRLQGVAAHPEASMLVYWNPRQQQVYVDAVALPPPPTGKQYQLWALQDGKPKDAGMIAVSEGKSGLLKMKNISSAQAFAVTLEPAGGSRVPTLEQLTVMGKIES
jgi:anti-sigma-K factor RskA